MLPTALKSDSHVRKKLVLSVSMEGKKMMKNDYFTLKSLLVLKIFNFFSPTFMIMWENVLNLF